MTMTARQAAERLLPICDEMDSIASAYASEGTHPIWQLLDLWGATYQVLSSQCPEVLSEIDALAAARERPIVWSA